MRNYLFIFISALIFTSCSSGSGEKDKKNEVAIGPKEGLAVAKPEALNENDFRQKVFDYTNGKELKFLGDKPCIVDFYADWCAPCRKLAPILEEIASEYNGKLNIYKINTDHNQDVSRYFNITSIPAVLLCPMEGKPQMMVGLSPKQEYVNAINQLLFKPSDTKK
jgi:thioredoxin 1